MNAKGREWDIDFRMGQLGKCGDPLTKRNEAVSWCEFRDELALIREKERKSNAGHQAFDVLLMFKLLILPPLYNLSDDALEYRFAIG